MTEGYDDDCTEMVLLPLLGVLDFMMARLFLAGRAAGKGSMEAQTKEEFFGFTCADVARIHTRKWGETDSSLFFRLHDGRVIDEFGQEHEPEPALYDRRPGLAGTA